MEPSLKAVAATLNAIEAAERGPDHPRSLAREAVRQWRQGTAINLRYDFNAQPVELKQIAYDATVRFSRRRWWSRLLR